MNWLAVHLPALALEVYERAMQHPPPLAVGERERLIACNDAARAQGVRPGLAESAARALLADLRILPRSTEAEEAALARLAAWAMGFSDQVSLAPPAGLVLEAGRSLRLFGGGESLLRQIREGIADLGYRARCVLAPTPAGALALAAVAPAETGISDDRYADRPDRDRGRANADRAAVDMADRPHGDQCSADALAARGLIADHDALRRALALLPVTVLGLDRREREDFDAMGLKRIGDLLRLPRGGLAERFGIERVQQLERLLGERPDPRHFFQPPQRFRAELQLPAEVPDSPALVFACRRLIDELGGFLLARQAGVQRLHWRLRHADSAATRFDLGAARIERDPERWLALLRERLERLRLPAPVRAVALVSETIRPLAPASGELFPEHAAAVDPDPALLDRLQARLGGNAVRGLMLLADHRPERAWRWCRPGEQGLHRRDGRQVRRRAGKARNADALPAADRAGAGPDPAHRGTGNRPLDAAWGADGPVRLDRPLWLLPEPMPLGLRNKRPWLDGPLDLGQGCERIETGWWDDFEVARDYYVATTVTGERLWIYREIYGARGWFLQGVFGGEY